MKIVYLALSIIGFVLPACFGQELIPLRASLHISSTISDGNYSLRKIVATAQEKGMNVVAVTDKALGRWEYGLRPLENILKKTVVNNSLLRYGARRYLADIKQVQTEYPQMVVLAGIDAAPFYYWSGSPLKNNLTINNWHKHILGIGLFNPRDYDYLPVIGNQKGLRTYFNPFSLWPLVFIISGVYLLRKKHYSYTDYTGRQLGRSVKGWQLAGGLLVLLNALFLLNNFPFFHVRFDQYHGDRGSMPYQNFIDYVNERGGITIWTHPEAEYISERNGVAIKTLSHEHALLTTQRYTGFSVYYDGYRKIGLPGGIWDELLLQYCAGKREKPVWAFGGLAFDMGTDLGRAMDNLHMVIFAAEENPPAVVEAMRNGRMYIAQGKASSTFSLSAFSAGDELDNQKAGMGDTLKISTENIVLTISADTMGEKKELTVTIIKEGSVVKTYAATTPFTISHSDSAVDAGITYYRLEVTGKWLRVITNPIFVAR